jgi:phosphate butyryltransferase
MDTPHFDIRKAETMQYADFDTLVARLRSRTRAGRMAVAAAGDRHTLEAVLEAAEAGLALPVLVGDREKILSILDQLGAALPQGAELIHVPDPAAACAQAVARIRAGEADFLMKGAVDSKVYLKAVVDREHGLGTGKLMSHFTLLQLPGYHKLLAPVDGGMVPYPTLEQKKEILLNSAEVFHKLGYGEVKAAVLACAEKVNPKMPETVEAAALQEMAERGELPGCIVEGPVSYDCAMRRDIADIKGFRSRVAGDVDLLLAPDIHAGNILGKALIVSCGARMAGFVVGAACPVVMSSRGATAEEKFLSIALAAAVSA